MPSELGLAIVGAGAVARHHARAIAATPGARLVAVSRDDQARATEAEQAFGVRCQSYEAVLARRDVDAVCLCTPSGLHAAQAIAAAQAGKHVLVEKPMALSLPDADAMITACQRAGVRLGIALQRRADPTFQDAQAAVAGGELGRAVLGLATVPYFRDQAYYDSATWRGTWGLDGGGALMNQGIHLADLLLWFLGDVAEVSAATTTLARAIEVEDSLAAALRFESGALGAIVATTAAAPGFPHRLEVYGTRGGLQIEGEAVVRWEGAAASRSAGSAGPLTRRTGPEGPQGAGAGAAPDGIGSVGHTRLMGDFVRAVLDGRPPLVPGPEGRRSLSFVLAVYEAARSGRPARPG